MISLVRNRKLVNRDTSRIGLLFLSLGKHNKEKSEAGCQLNLINVIIMNNGDIIKWTYCDLYHYFDEMTDACNDFLCCLVFSIRDVTFARQADSFIGSECLSTYVIFSSIWL